MRADTCQRCGGEVPEIYRFAGICRECVRELAMKMLIADFERERRSDALVEGLPWKNLDNGSSV